MPMPSGCGDIMKRRRMFTTVDEWRIDSAKRAASCLSIHAFIFMHSLDAFDIDYNTLNESTRKHLIYIVSVWTRI